MPTAPALSITGRKITSPDMKGPDWCSSIQIRITCCQEREIRTPRQAIAALAKPNKRTRRHSLIVSGGRGAVLKGLQKRIGFSPWKHFARKIAPCDRCGRPASPVHIPRLEHGSIVPVAVQRVRRRMMRRTNQSRVGDVRPSLTGHILKGPSKSRLNRSERLAPLSCVDELNAKPNPR